MKVELIGHTNKPEQMIAIAGKTCYSQNIPDEVDISNGYLDRLHDGCFEHATYTFAVSGVSRALTHQLVRHRVASFDQQSQRYCEIKTDKDDWFVTPPTMLSPETLNAYLDAMETASYCYDMLINEGIPEEDARFVLPNACKSNIIVTMNARELMHFFGLRCCNRAQWEIRELANKMLELCKECSPEIFKNAGANCVQLGYCPEHRSCGKCKTLAQLKENTIKIGNMYGSQIMMDVQNSTIIQKN